MKQSSDPVVFDGSNEDGSAGLVVDSQQPSQQRQGGGEGPNESMKENNEDKSQSQVSAHEQKAVAAESTVAQESALAAQTEESLKDIRVNGEHEVEAQSHHEEQGPAVDEHHSSVSKDVSIKNAENTNKESNSGEDAEAVKDNKDGIEQPQETTSQPVPGTDPGKGTEEHVNPSNLHATSSSPVPAGETPGSEHRDISEDTTTQHHGTAEERAVDAGAQESDEVITGNAESNNPSNQLPTKTSNDGPPIVESTLSNKDEKQEDKVPETSSPEMGQQNGRQEMANYADHRGDPAKSHQLTAGNAPSSVPHNSRLSLQPDQRLRTDGPHNQMEGEPRRAHFNHFPEHPDKSRQPIGPRPAGEMPYKDIMDSRYKKPVESSQLRHEPGKSTSAGDFEMPKRKQRRGTVPFGAMNSDGHEEPYDSDRRRASRSRASPPQGELHAESDREPRGQESSHEISRGKRRISGEKGEPEAERGADEVDDRRLERHIRTDVHKKDTNGTRRTSKERMRHESRRQRDPERREDRHHRSDAPEHGTSKHHESRLKSHPRRSSSEKYDRDRDPHPRRRSSPASARSGSLRNSLVVILLKSASILRNLAHRHAKPRTSRSADPMRPRRSRRHNDMDESPDVSPARRAPYRKASRSRSRSSGESRERERHSSERRRHRESADDLRNPRSRREIEASPRRRHSVPYTTEDRDVTPPRTSDGRYLEPVHSYDGREPPRERRQRSQHTRGKAEPEVSPRQQRRPYREQPV